MGDLPRASPPPGPPPPPPRVAYGGLQGAAPRPHLDAKLRRRRERLEAEAREATAKAVRRTRRRSGENDAEANAKLKAPSHTPTGRRISKPIRRLCVNWFNAPPERILGLRRHSRAAPRASRATLGAVFPAPLAALTPQRRPKTASRRFQEATRRFQDAAKSIFDEILSPIWE